MIPRNPIGMRISSVGYDHPRTTYQIVGVANNAHTHNFRGDVAPRFFVAGQQILASVKSPTLLIRTAADPAPVLAVPARPSSA